MPITQGMCTSFLNELYSGTHDLTTDTLKLALYTDSATLSFATTTYTGTTNEVASGGGYTTGGNTVTMGTPTVSGQTAYVDIANVEWLAATFTCRGALLYNTSSGGNEAVCVLDFGSNKSPSAETFTVVFPTADADNAIIRITGG